MSFDINMTVNISKLYAKLAYRFGVANINDMLEEYERQKGLVVLLDDDELTDWYGDYYINKHTFNPENIKDPDELTELTLAVLASQELQRRGLSIWNIKERYLYNHDIDINVVDITYLDLDDDFDELKNLANWGHIKAIEEIAMFYASPAGGSNDKLCIQYWSLAAKLGSAKSQETLASLTLQEIRGLKFNAEKVIYYYKCAARQGESKSIKFIQDNNIDIDSPVISKEEIDRVTQIYFSKKNAKKNYAESPETTGGNLLGIIFGILFWAFIIYKFVL